MVAFRQEPWGHVLYDTQFDEFFADVSDEDTPVLIERPISAGCLVTGRCNLRCAFCYGNDEALPSTEMTAAEWRAAFRILRDWGLMRVDLSGGEPTVRCDVAEIAIAAKNEGLHVVLSTNGLLLSKTGPIGIPNDVRIHVSLDSGFAQIHERSRILRNFRPSDLSFPKVGDFIRRSLDSGFRVRVLTCVGIHNKDCLFQLGEYIATLGVREWNISRILRAGRAQRDFELMWDVDDSLIVEQVQAMREVFPSIRIRFSNRTEQDGYFLLVLPDGSVATQYTDGNDKVRLGHIFEMSLEDLRTHPRFDLQEHGLKWITAATDFGIASLSHFHALLN